MGGLIGAARARGLRLMEGEVLASNKNMLKLMDILGFNVTVSSDDPNIRRAAKMLKS